MDYKNIYNFCTVSNDIKIKESLILLDKSELKILFIINKENQLIGTLTDGDIRRYLNLEYPDLSKTVETIMSKNPKFIFEKDLFCSTSEKLKKFEVNFLPVLNENKNILKVIFMNINFERESELNNTIVIMAGGKGARLMPLTRIIPKPLVPFRDKTIIENIMEQFIKVGFHKFIAVVNYKKEVIKQYFEDLEYDINFIEEEDFLGTAGGLELLENKNIEKAFFVSNCDILLEIDYVEALEFHIKESSELTIIASMENIDISYGVVMSDYNENYVSLVEKPNYNFLINTGIYILNPSILNFINKNEKLDMPDLIERVKQKNMKIKIFATHKKMVDIGQWEYYKKFINVD
jgi:dTDP-glucose pyrophosphorylase